MSDNIPDPYLAQTGFDADFLREGAADDEESDLEFDDADDELGIEEDRAREG